MNDYKLGVYAGAVGLPDDDRQPHEWRKGRTDALLNISNGYDPFGRPPNRPHQCARDLRLVCNCADSARANCTHDRFPPAPKIGASLLNIARRLKREIKERL